MNLVFDNWRKASRLNPVKTKRDMATDDKERPDKARRGQTRRRLGMCPKNFVCQFQDLFIIHSPMTVTGMSNFTTYL